MAVPTRKQIRRARKLKRKLGSIMWDLMLKEDALKKMFKKTPYSEKEAKYFISKAHSCLYRIRRDLNPNEF